jgi:hypothetical protein
MLVHTLFGHFFRLLVGSLSGVTERARGGDFIVTPGEPRDHLKNIG